MSKVVIAFVSLLVVAGSASAGIIDPCQSNCVISGSPPPALLSPAGPPWVYFACPQGDTDSFQEQGFIFSFTIVNLLLAPIPDIPASDFWLINCDPAGSLTLCAGSASSAADSATNSAGQTTMSDGTLNAGGCTDGLSPVVQGFVLEDPLTGCTPYCYLIQTRSPDLDGSMLVNLVDLAIFSSCFPPQPYDKCCDFDGNATVNLQDLARFAFHFGPPGHKCN